LSRYDWNITSRRPVLFRRDNSLLGAAMALFSKNNSLFQFLRNYRPNTKSLKL